MNAIAKLNEVTPVTVEFKLDQQTVVAFEGESILKAAKRHGIDIPHLCYSDGLRADGNCRACVVEIKGERTLAPSCCRNATAGMEVLLKTPRVEKSQKMVLEMLLSDMPDVGYKWNDAGVTSGAAAPGDTPGSSYAAAKSSPGASPVTAGVGAPTSSIQETRATGVGIAGIETVASPGSSDTAVTGGGPGDDLCSHHEEPGLPPGAVGAEASANNASHTSANKATPGQHGELSYWAERLGVTVRPALKALRREQPKADVSHPAMAGASVARGFSASTVAPGDVTAKAQAA